MAGATPPPAADGRNMLWWPPPKPPTAPAILIYVVAPALPHAFSHFRAPTDAALRRSVRGVDGLLAEMIRHHLGWEDPAGTGKALRPVLCLLVCEAWCGRAGPAVDAAAAVELVHNFSLIHDDIQDGDRTRRHRATVWARFGMPQAINAGDALLALAQRTILGPSLSVRRQQAAAVLASATARMVAGQVLDLAHEGRLGGGLRPYLAMIRLKTGALMGCACEVGAICGGAPPQAALAARRAGEAIGLAFQIRDDVLGIWGDPVKTGKPRASDLNRRKATYPVLALDPSRHRRAHAAVRRLYRSAPPPARAVDRVVGLLEATSVREGAQRAAERQAVQAIQVLRTLPLKTRSRRELEELIGFVVTRDG
jgi:geranylgeranyl diphosphate synthase type I